MPHATLYAKTRQLQLCRHGESGVACSSLKNWHGPIKRRVIHVVLGSLGRSSRRSRVAAAGSTW